MNANATPSAELPSWLSIARLDDRRYQLTDISVASIGYCLGIFPCREAAESIAVKIAKSRADRPAGAFLKSKPTIARAPNAHHASLQ